MLTVAPPRNLVVLMVESEQRRLSYAAGEYSLLHGVDAISVVPEIAPCFGSRVCSVL